MINRTEITNNIYPQLCCGHKLHPQLASWPHWSQWECYVGSVGLQLNLCSNWQKAHCLLIKKMKSSIISYAFHKKIIREELSRESVYFAGLYIHRSVWKLLFIREVIQILYWISTTLKRHFYSLCRCRSLIKKECVVLQTRFVSAIWRHRWYILQLAHTF